MRRRILLITLAALVVLAAGAYLAVRLVLGSDVVRAALEDQLEMRLGQPVAIGSATASIFPRLAVTLHDVDVGQPAAVQLGRVKVVTGLRGLLSRTVSDAAIEVVGGRIRLPLPFALGVKTAAPPSGAPESSALVIESIETIRFRDLALAAPDVSFVIDMDASVAGDRLDIERLTAAAERTRIDASGALASIANLEGRLQARADPLHLEELIALGAALGSGEAPPPAAGQKPSSVALALDLRAPSGSFSSYPFSDLDAAIEIGPEAIEFRSLAGRLFGGTFTGRLDVRTAGAAPELSAKGRVDGVQIAPLLQASGSPGGMTGLLGGDFSVRGRGADTATLVRTARGSFDAAVTDGAMPGLDMVRTIVLAFGRSSGAPAEGTGSSFSRLGGTFTLGDGALVSQDLVMEAPDFDLRGEGALQIASGALDARARVRLSETLTAQAGTDLRRFTQEEGRIVVPATIAGTLERPSVRLDMAAATTRAIENELKRRTKGLFDRLLRK